MKTYNDYNIPFDWKKDIATCGTSSHQFYRNQLWYDWTETQRLHATSMYHPVFDRLEKLAMLKNKHNRFFFGEEYCAAYFSLPQVIGIDLGEQYTTAQLLQLVDDAIDKENKSFEEEMAKLYEYYEEMEA